MWDIINVPTQKLSREENNVVFKTKSQTIKKKSAVGIWLDFGSPQMCFLAGHEKVVHCEFCCAQHFGQPGSYGKWSVRLM